MIGLKRVCRIKIRVQDLKRVLRVYDALKEKSFIEFAPTGLFSGYIDVLYEDDTFLWRLRAESIPFYVKRGTEVFFVTPNETLGYTANHKTDDNENPVCDLVTKEELNSAIASLRTGGNDKIRKEVTDVLASLFDDSDENQNKGTNGNTEFIKASDVRNIKLQRTKITERQLLNFKLEKRRTKWELIKALQEEFDKLPDETEFNSFSAIGIGIGRSRYL